MKSDFPAPLPFKATNESPGGSCLASAGLFALSPNRTLMILACASMRQSVFPHMAQNMLTSCCQSVTSCLPHHTVEVTRAYATRPAKQQQMVNILGPPAIVMDASEA